MDTNGSIEKFGYEQSLKRALPLSSLVFFGFAYLSVTTIFSTYGLVSSMTHGMLALSYIVATVAMLFTALSYGRMAAAYPIAGSTYSYTQRSINPHIGFLGGWAILMDYLLIPMICCLLGAIFFAPYFPGVPSWVWIILLMVLATVINFFGIQVTAIVNNTVILLQIVFAVGFIIFIAKWLVTGNGAATFFDMNAIFNATEFNKPEMGWGIILSGASILALSFLGFDAVSTMAEEAINPEKNLGRATLIICLGAGAFFIGLSYLMQLSWPTGWQEFKVVDSGAQELMVKIGGSVLSYAFITIYSISNLACIVASQSAGARVLFGMGRDGALPKKFFGYVHPKYKVPTMNLLLVGCICLTSLFLDLGTAASLINFGALLGFILVNLSVVFHYFIRKKERTGLANIVRNFIAPIIGAAVCFLIWMNLDIHSKILGFVWLAVGAIYLAATTNFFRKLPPDLKLDE